MTRTLVCYGDSNTWAANPEDISRFPRHVRWTGKLQELLGDSWHVVEAGLPNRTTCFEDPEIPYRNGLEYFGLTLETNSPVSLAMVMLGTNDLKLRVCGSVELASLAVPGFAQIASDHDCRLLIVSPALLTNPIRFSEFPPEAAEASKQFGSALKSICDEQGIDFFDAAQIVSPSPRDGVHLDADSHALLAGALGEWVQKNAESLAAKRSEN